MHLTKAQDRQPRLQRPEKIVNPDSVPAASKERAASKRTRRMNMNHYQVSSPRKVFAIAAVAMTALTLGLSVVVPAQIQSGASDPRMLAASNTVAPAAVEAVAPRLHVEVVGVRDPELVSVQVRNPLPKRKQES
jgi:hypothetical protein